MSHNKIHVADWITLITRKNLPSQFERNFILRPHSEAPAVGQNSCYDHQGRRQKNFRQGNGKKTEKCICVPCMKIQGGTPPVADAHDDHVIVTRSQNFRKVF